MRGEGDEGKIDAIQHQLDGHENRDDVALDEESETPQAKRNALSSRYQEMGIMGYSPSFLGPRATASGRLASTTAPMMAIRMSTDVTSKGSR